jgi:hypothetical protein
MRYFNLLYLNIIIIHNTVTIDVIIIINIIDNIVNTIMIMIDDELKGLFLIFLKLYFFLIVFI